MSTGMHNYGSGRRTWAKWRERNTGNYDEAIRYARGGYLNRVPEIVHGDCVIEFMPDQSRFVDRLTRPRITGTIDLEWMADFLWKYYGQPYRDMRLAKEWADELFGKGATDG